MTTTPTAFPETRPSHNFPVTTSGPRHNYTSIEHRYFEMGEVWARCCEKISRVLDQTGEEMAAELIQKTSSSALPQSNDPSPMPVTAYKSLVRKYNTLYENWLSMKDARDKLEKYLRDEKVKTNDYHQKEKVQQQQTANLKNKTHMLEEEIRSLKGECNLASNSGRIGSERPSSSICHSSSKSEVPTMPAAISPQPNAHDVVLTERAGTIPQNAGREPEIFSQTRDGDSVQNGNIHPESCLLPTAMTSIEMAGLGNGMEVVISRSPQKALSRLDDENLSPPALDDGTKSLEPSILFAAQRVGGSGVASVEDTQFVDIEFHHSSSTQDDIDHFSSSPRAANQAASVLSPKSSLLSSPDVPVVVSTRAVKKRKPRESPDFQRPPTTRIKVEELVSSSPILHAFNECDSIDLDDIGHKQMTPRKQQPPVMRRVSSQLSSATRGLDNLNCRVLATGTSSIGIPTSRMGAHQNGSTLRPLSTIKKILPRTTENRTPKRRRVAIDKAITNLLEDDEENFITNDRPRKVPNQEIDILKNMLEKPTPPKKFLGPVVRVLPATEVNSPGAKLKLNEGSSVEALKTPVTSGADRSYVTAKGKSSIFGARTAFKKKRPTTNTSNVGAIIESVSKDVLKGLKHASISAADTTSATTRMTVAQRRSLAAEEIFNADVDHPSNEPLRARPLQKLNLKDFKVNPNYNQGKDYAFTDVVRNKDARRCLQGCTRPDCCGTKFRKLAILMREPDEVLTSSQEEADQALLQDFLGGNAHTLKKMGKEEREELLLQARTRELANKHGRHRYAYERPKSPVGYWRIDFPTTQEEIEDRQKIKQREREKVEQRYREAMRPGGAYIFNDE